MEHTIEKYNSPTLVGSRVLVTGAAGFIGSHLVELLVEHGAEVRAMAHYRGSPLLDNLEFLPEGILQRVEVVRGDIQDSYFVREAIRGVDYVFHLAALIGIPYSYVAPASYVRTNIEGTLCVLEACKKEGVRRLIHTSTSECYGSAKYVPIDEDHPLQGQSPYSATKIAADMLADSYFRSFELPVVTVRPFNTYGPRQSPRAVIPTIMRQIVAQTATIRLGSLDPVRDMTYVLDTALGFIRAAISEDVEGETINLGTGEAHTIGTILDTIQRIAGTDIPVICEEVRVRPEKSEVTRLVSNNAKAKMLLDWSPSISLEEGLRRSLNHVQSLAQLGNTIDYSI